LAEGANHRRQMVGEAPAPAELASPDERAMVDEALRAFDPFERSQLLPLLQDVQARSGMLSKGLLGYLSQRVRVPFAELYGVASFYALLNTGQGTPRVRLCSGVPCILAGAESLAHMLRQEVRLDWSWFPCIGQCDRAPAALVDDEPIYHLTPSHVLAVAHGNH
jgi:NADH:ubiquinone oxidoreductase subunit E